MSTNAACHVLRHTRMQNPQSIPYSQRPLPELHAALVELQLYALRWLTPVWAPARMTACIHRAAMTATMSVEVAAHGPRQRPFLKRAKEAAHVFMSALRQLEIHGGLDLRILDEARRRTDQVLLGLDQLAVTPVEEWTALHLPPLAPEPAAPPPESPVAVARRAVAARAWSSPISPSSNGFQTERPASGEREAHLATESAPSSPETERCQR